jgi:simple sugar transport system substrate-binding protein
MRAIYQGRILTFSQGFRFLGAAVIFFLLAGCGGGTEDRKSAPYRDPGNKPPQVRELLNQYMPEQMTDGIVKVAIIRNFAVGDHTRQFLEGCVTEGRSMGFIVDTFITAGDNELCRKLIARISRADYDGLILFHGDADFTYDALKPAVYKPMKVVTFDALPYKNGDPAQEILPGVTSTAQDDVKLAQSSLNAILSLSADPPARVIRAWSGPGIPPLDRRLSIYNEFVQQGRIEEAAWIYPRDFAFSRSGVREALSAILPEIPEGSVDAIWASYDEFAKGCIDALEDAGRQDIKMVSIDISNDDIKLMLEHPDLWIATVAVDPRFIGIVNMRLLAAKFAREATPETYIFTPQTVNTTVLTNRLNMANIAGTVEDWGREQGIFDGYLWMAALKTAVKTYIRLPERDE